MVPGLLQMCQVLGARHQSEVGPMYVQLGSRIAGEPLCHTQGGLSIHRGLRGQLLSSGGTVQCRHSRSQLSSSQCQVELVGDLVGTQLDQLADLRYGEAKVAGVVGN